jgi:hypothetical protein
MKVKISYNCITASVVDPDPGRIGNILPDPDPDRYPGVLPIRIRHRPYPLQSNVKINYTFLQ